MVRVIIIVLCTLMCSCQLRDIEQILSTAERQLTTAPDSALTTIRSVKWYSVLKPERRAKYGLIHSIALDKNYIDVTSDSLIRFSTRYYDYKGSPEQRMRAYYYLGRVQENNREYLPAILSLLDAAQYADAVDDNYLKGLLFSRLGTIYRHYYNYEKAYKYFEQSYNCYKAAGLKKHQAYQLYEMGFLSFRRNDNQRSIELLSEVVELSTEIDDVQILKWANIILAMAYDKISDFDNSYRILKYCENEFGSGIYNHSYICASAANTFTHKGYKKKADELLIKGWEYAKNSVDSSIMHIYVAYIEYYLQRYNSYYENFNRGLYMQLSIANDRLNNSVDKAEGEYFEQKAVAAKNIAVKQRNMYITILMVIVIGVVVFLSYNQRKIRLQRKSIENSLAAIADIKMGMQNQTKEVAVKLQAMIKNKFDIFDELCNLYYEQPTYEKKQTTIYNKVHNLISSFRTDAKMFSNIENIVNDCCDNAMAKLRNEMPKLREDEYKMLCYTFAGFSNQAMAVFFNCESGTVATRKSRLKSQIAKSNAPNKELFASLFEQCADNQRIKLK